MFDCGLRRPRQLKAPVISVGNLAAGGTGKTPLVELICQRLAAANFQPAVLSRGYKGDGTSNDEARMLAWPVICDPNRFRGGQQALHDGATVCVLDDGFQHRQLARDLDIICIDATRPWGRSDGGRGRTLPLGLLREAPPAMARAQLAVITRCDQATDQRLAQIKRIVQHHGLACIHARHQPTVIRDLDDQDELPAASLAGQRVIALSAIGNPQAFITTLTELDAEVIADYRYPDHHTFGADEIDQALGQGDELVVVTAKDATKLKDLSLARRSAIRVLHITCTLREPDNGVLDQHLHSALGGRTAE